MSMSAAFSSALSGLTASSRMANVTSSNIANALTEGYGRREVQLSPRLIGMTGTGVAVSGVTRSENPYLQGEMREASAGEAFARERSSFLTSLERMLGTSEDAGSLSARITAFERSLVEAAARPEAEARLAAVLDAADAITTKLRTTTRSLQEARQDADRRIAADVETLNASLSAVSRLGSQIRSLRATGGDVSALLDQRQIYIDRISTIIPVKEIARENDQIALMTTGGTLLLDARPVTIGFRSTATITADMTAASGGLSGLTLDGRPMDADAVSARLGEGRLSALFSLRDDLAPRAQAQLDGLAADLVGRFAEPGLDPSLGAGMAGLFTDAGALVLPGDEAGLAGRIAVNAAADPDRGGALWRLRDGLGAAAPGAPGDSRLLSALSAAAITGRLPPLGGFSTAAGLSGLATAVLSDVSGRRLSFEADLGFAATQTDTFRSELLKAGVDTDQEMQNLLNIEKAYAANARVLQTLDGMLETLLGI
jgi:flagellar hook-associated protein 1 FlgK